MPRKDPVAAPAAARGRRRPHRRGEHRAAILLAAHRLVEQNSDFTTQELIDEAGVALKTFYRHFTSKDHLLIAVLGDLIREHAEDLAARASNFEDPVDRLRFIVTDPLRAMNEERLTPTPNFVAAQHWRLHELHPDEVAAATAPFADLIRRTLEDGRSTGALAPRDPERDAWLIAQLVMVVFHHYAFHPDDPGRETAADDVWAFCAASLTPPVPAPRRKRASSSPDRRRRTPG